ncbi:MAG: portal protein, partial [Pseudomonadales bacterium]|nr:portal protein [Pseudomonadales bacterium]
MTQDRPIVAFPWDIVPSRFWGRGVCEKGYSSQKALDAEMRARIDALALTTHPMMAIDATRIPRSSKMEIRPGRMLLTNGDPKASIMPFNFGNVSQITFAQAQSLQMMVQQATGALDGAQMAQNPGQEATSAGVAMSLGAVIKRQKRTLVNFQDTFLKPLIKKAAHRFMQFSPEEYPVKDYKFTIISSLGVVAREYEVGQLSQVLQTLPPGTPQHGAVTKAIIEHLNTSSREEILATIDQASQPNPQAQQQAMQQAQLQMELQVAQNNLINAQAAESQSRANKYAVEADLAPKETVLKYSDADKDGSIDDDFDRKARMAGILLEQERFELERQERLAAIKNAANEQATLREMLKPKPNSNLEEPQIQ